MKQRWHFRQSSSSIVQHGVKKPHVSYCMTTSGMAAWTAAATLAGCSNNSWLRQLAQSGFQEAQHRVGAICVRGQGIPRGPIS
jgi:hypothetical protein